MMQNRKLIQTYATIDSCVRMARKRSHQGNGPEPVLPDALGQADENVDSCRLVHLLQYSSKHWPDLSRALDFVIEKTKLRVLEQRKFCIDMIYRRGNGGEDPFQPQTLALACDFLDRFLVHQLKHISSKIAETDPETGGDPDNVFFFREYGYISLTCLYIAAKICETFEFYTGDEVSVDMKFVTDHANGMQRWPGVVTYESKLLKILKWDLYDDSAFAYVHVFLKYFFPHLTPPTKKNIVLICKLLIQASNMQNSFYLFTNAEVAISSILFATNKTGLAALAANMHDKRMETELKGFLSEENIADCYFGMAVSYSSSLSNKRQCLGSGGCEKKKRKLSGTDAACKTGNPKLSTLRKVQTA